MAKLAVVGGGTPTPTLTRWGTSFLLEAVGQKFLIDCGPATTHKLLHQFGVASTAIEHLFFTHLHSDHVADYPCFLMTRFDQSIGSEPDLKVYGPSPFRDIHERLWSPERGVFWYDVIARTNHPMSINAYHSRGGQGDRPPPVVEVTEFGPGVVATGDGWQVSALEVKHAQPYIECFGFRFETDDGIIGFSGDTAPCEAVVELCRDADLAVIEAVHREVHGRNLPSVISETSTDSAGRMAAEAGAKRLLINHQSTSMEGPGDTARAIADVLGAYDGDLWWGRDGVVVEF